MDPQSPQVNKEERYRFYLGALVVIGMMTLAIFVALGKVEEKTSYGLSPILMILGKVVLDFAVWAFPNNTTKNDSKDETPKHL